MRTNTLMRHALKGPRRLVALVLLGLAMSACAAFPSATVLQAGAVVDESAAAHANGTVAAAPLAAGVGLPASSSIIGRFAPVYMGSHWSFSLTQAVTLAKEFDVIAAQANVFSEIRLRDEGGQAEPADHRLRERDVRSHVGRDGLSVVVVRA